MARLPARDPRRRGRLGFCNGPELGTRGTSSGALDGRAIITGICEPDATGLVVRVRRRDEPIEVPVHGGFFGALLPEDVDPKDVAPAHRCRR